MDTKRPSEDLFYPTSVSHPHWVEFPRRGSYDATPNTIPGAEKWLEENVPDDDWEWGTHFGTLFYLFKDKAKAALFRTFFA